MSYVFVVDTDRHPLNPVHPARARILLSSGKAAVLKRSPFTIVLKTSVEQPTLTPLRLKLDPGSNTTGIALVNDQSGQLFFAADLSHRGHAIKDALQSRRGVRRSRRNRQTRYRKPRFSHRRRPRGWLPPSLQSRISDITSLVQRLQKVCRVSAISVKLVKFDLQQMENPEMCGAEYQQGTLAGYELREYLLDKWHRTCAYCGTSGVPLCIKASGHGNWQMCGTDKHGFPIRDRQREKVHHGYQTGGLVRAVVPEPLKTAGTHVGRVLARATGSFDITTKPGTRVAGVGYQYCRPIQRCDGYSYTKGAPYAGA